MSFGNPLKNFGRIQQLIFVGLIAVVAIVWSYFINLDFWTKLGISALAFFLACLSMIAGELLNLQKEAAAKEAQG